MKYKWLNKGVNNSKLILFFNGWGMDENVVKHLDCENYDVLMFYDYNTLNTDFDWDLLDVYPEKNLIAWSMGVMVCSCLAPSLTLPLGERKSLYNKILISDNDKIIPTKSQVAFWGIEPNLKSGHCPFFQFKKWSELL